MMTTLNSGASDLSDARRSSATQIDAAEKPKPSPGLKWAQSLVLVALFVFTAVLCLRNAATADPDVWFHLRTGEWIVEHSSLPHTEPFSAYGAGKPWVAYSWLYELIVFKLFTRLGLVGLTIYTTAMGMCIIAMLHRLIRRVGGDFTIGVLLAALAAVSMSRIYMPRPWLFTVLLFIVELDLLMHARMTGKVKALLFLPLIFALWSNLHIQFIGGLVVLAIVLIEALLARRVEVIKTRIPAGPLTGVFLLCIAGTLANPYLWRVYQVIHELASESGELNKVTELAALPFRRLDDWLVLFLLMAATAALARARRVDFFESALLLFAAYASFRSQRDLWVVVIVSTLILAGRIRGNERNKFFFDALTMPAVILVTTLLVLLSFKTMNVNNDRLGSELANSFPVHAVEAIKQNGWKGPLFNDYTWGGYLLWSLRLPVSTDGRQNVYGDAVLDRSYATWNAQPEWDHDPDLMRANLVVAEINAPLTQVLRLDPHFRLAYEDKIAAVFISEKARMSAGDPTP